MNHVEHIQSHAELLKIRFYILRLIREFFWSNGFIEVETPLVLRYPGQEPYLSPMPIALHNERGEAFGGYLHTSPEYTMKKMLAAGFKKIFFLGKCFRDYESFGGTHNPEFTMIEWYRSQSPFIDVMDDTEALFRYVGAQLKKSVVSFDAVTVDINGPWERLHMKDAWQKYAQVNLDAYLKTDALRELCMHKGYATEPGETYESLFFKIFLNEIEPYLGIDVPIILHHFPAPLAALSRMSEVYPGYAERFEVYIAGLEIANAFGELTDATEQLRRLQYDQAERKNMNKEVFAIDQEFVKAVERMPTASGIALGVDRMVQLFTGLSDIDEVLLLPTNQLFGDSG